MGVAEKAAPSTRRATQIALACPACAAPLSMPEGDTVARCPHCGSYALFRGEAGIGRFVLPSLVSSTDALRSVGQIMSSRNVAADAMGSSSVRRPQLFFVPFWHAAVQAHGYVLGVEPVYEEEEIPIVAGQESTTTWVLAPKKRVKRRTGSKGVERQIRLGCTVNVSGADMEPLGIPSLSADSQLAISGLEIQRTGLPDGLEVLNSSRQADMEGIFVDPSIHVSEAVAQAERVAKRLARGAGMGLERRWEYVVLAGQRCSLIYYPLWVVSFLYRGRSYRAVCDGRSGRVLRGSFPGRTRHRRVLAALAASFWAGVAPFAVNVMIVLSGPEWNRGRQTGACIGVVLAGLIGIGVLTHRLLKALEEVSSGASPDDYQVWQG